METMRKSKGLIRWVVLGLVLILVIGCILGSIRVIPEGHIGVRTQLGAITDIHMDAGPVLKLPVIQTIDTVDVREHVYETEMTAYTKDTQTIESVRLKLNYSYDLSRISDLIRTVGINYVESKLIQPLVSSVFKNTTGKYKAEELVQNRSDLQEQVETELRETLRENGIIVSALNIENIDFEDSFEEAVRKKVEAEQKAQEAQNTTILKEEEARQQVIAAQAEADSQRVQAEAEAYAIELIQKQLSASPEYIQLQMVEKWNGEWPKVMGNEVNPFVMFGSDEMVYNEDFGW